MFSIYWKLTIPLAILIQIALFYRHSTFTYDPDIESAINRARTDSCKKELEHFAAKISNDLELFQPQLRRTCRLDKNKQRIQRIGCISNTTNGLVKIEEPVSNASMCLDNCFTYGHSFGGYQTSTESCFCGDIQSNLVTDDHKNSVCSELAEIDWFQVNAGIYQPTNSDRTSTEINERGPIRIAFLLILSGRSDFQVRRLLKNIYSRNHLFYLHIDKRDDFIYYQLLELEKRYSNIILARSRFNTVWGGTSLLRMIIDTMNHLSQYRWDYLINLSESDFPIKPLKKIEDYLRKNIDSIFLKSHNIRGYNFIKKQGLDKNFYQCENRVWRMNKRQLPRGIIFTGGSDWFALPRDFCNYILDNLSNSKSLVKPLVQLYNFTLLPAESFFHTLALNSEFCDRFVDHNLRLTNWHRKQGCKCQHKNVVDWCGCSPLIYRYSDWQKLKNTNSSENLFFSRKFDPTVSSSIISLVENELVKGEAVNDNKTTDLAYWQDVYTLNNATRQILQQVGSYAIKQIQNLVGPEKTSFYSLLSVHTHFKDDRFIGLLYNYCDQIDCIQFMLEKTSNSQVQDDRVNCFSSKRSFLKVIEVNHGFDTGERMFRDYLPLQDLSEIAVYHEWIVGQLDRNQNNSNGKLLFSWFSPTGQVELIQNVKLKPLPKPTRLSLAHRLLVKKSLLPGLWTLCISYRGQKCLSYDFLVFNGEPYTNSIKQEVFNRFYNVTKYCTSKKTLILKNSTGDYSLQDCSQYDWTLQAKRKYDESFAVSN